MSDGETTWNFTYDANGMRTSRTNGTTIYKYVYNGGTLVQMSVGSNTLYFTSDTVTFNGTTYYYVTNLQGDIVAILNSGGTAVVQYTYDAWGNILSIDGSMADTLGQLNPLRYRGYVYDPESDLYYLQSRYYDPELGRFINVDSYASTGQGILSNNMFAYCGNNPIIHCDPSGYWWNEFWEEVEERLKKKKTEAQSNDDGTVTVGFTIAGAFGLGGSYSTGITLDRKGNIGMAGTFNGGSGFPSAGAGGFATITNAPDIFAQEGLGTAIGGSIGPGAISVGGEYNQLIDAKENVTYHGGTIAVTVGLYPACFEWHGEAGYTRVLGYNVFDVMLNVVDHLHE